MRMFVVIVTCVFTLAGGTAAAYDVSAVVEKFRQEALMDITELNRCATVLDSALSQAPDENRSPVELAKAATSTMRSKDCFDLFSHVEDANHPVVWRNTGTFRNPEPQVREVNDNLVITIPTFDMNLVDIGKALRKQLQAMSADWRSFVKRVVVDVRGNGGGEILNLREALELLAPRAGMDFMRIHFSSGALDPSVGRAEYQTTRAQGPLQNLPIVFLIDRGTMSATEWFVATSRYEWYSGQVTVVGASKTVGKAIFQCKNPVGGFVLQVTCAHWTVAGKDIHGIGIEPDRKLDLSDCKFDYPCILEKLGLATVRHASQ